MSANNDLPSKFYYLEKYESWIKYSFKCMDILFKIISWLLATLALQYADSKIESKPFHIFTVVISLTYFTFLSCGFLFVMTAQTKNLGLSNIKYGSWINAAIKLAVLPIWFFFTIYVFIGEDIMEKLVAIKNIK